MTTISDSVMSKLGLTADELNSMFTACPVDGATSEATIAKLEAAFGTSDPDELASRGVLTKDEADYLADRDA